MKKSKVIIPAMAMILFSTAASISGTVAWFTASRVFSMTAGDFHIAQLEGNLEAEVTPGIGTMLTDDHTLAVGRAQTGTGNENKQDTNYTNYLVDASFDHNSGSGKIYKQNRDDTSVYDEYAPYGSATDTLYTSSNLNGWIYKSVTGTGSAVTNYYLAVSWKITFTYNFSDNEKTKDIGIYLDLNNSNFALTEGSVADKTGTGAKNAKKGFRIAFVSTPRTVVWGDLADTSSYDTTVASNTYSYIKDVSSTGTETKYNNPNGNGSGTQAEILTHAYTTSGTYALAEDSVAANQYRADRISTIAKPTSPATSSSVDVTCVAWFEGCDLNVMNGTALQTVEASMKFYSRIDA